MDSKHSNRDGSAPFSLLHTQGWVVSLADPSWQSGDLFNSARISWLHPIAMKNQTPGGDFRFAQCLPNMYILVIFGHHLVFSQNPKLMFHIVSLDKTPHVSLVYHKVVASLPGAWVLRRFRQAQAPSGWALGVVGLVPGTARKKTAHTAHTAH